MATLQNRNGRWRAMVRRKGHQGQTRTFPNKTAAKTWTDRVEHQMADLEVRAARPSHGENITITKLIAWRTEVLASVKGAEPKR
ncbi:hypothetical protein [Stenotrophomonas maltophilia]|uniref:hypothetical protein n=1 Tax=Stenotrophomonas maltophilia TaxID=40324 RepID=UPI0039C37F63